MFEQLDRAGIDHVVARRAELLPAPPIGDDIDVVVGSKDLPRIAPLAKELAQKHGGFCFDADVFVGSGQYLFFFPGPLGEPDVRHFHFQDSISHRGVELVPNNEMLRNRQRDGRFWRPSPGMEGASLLLHDLVGKAAFRARDLEQLRRLQEEHPNAVRHALESLLDKAVANRIVEALDSEGGAALLPLRSRVRGCRLRSQPVHLIRWWLAHFLRNASYMFQRRGALVVLIGPDGSGKTTLVNEVCRILQVSGRKAERLYFGLTSPMLPTKRLMKAFHRKRAPAGPRVDDEIPSKASFKTNLAYFLGTSHSLVDQYLRYWVHARPRLARARILLCDRYFYDALASPAPGVLKWLLDFWTIWLTPRADLVFVLQDEPQAIHDRKPELTVSEIERQQQRFQRLKGQPLFGITINIQPDPRPNAREIARATLKAFSKRNG